MATKPGVKTGLSVRAKARAKALGLDGADQVKTLGRPRTTVQDLPKNWQDIMFEEAREGGGPTAFMVKLGIGHTSFQTLLTDSEIFQSTYESCMLLHKYWWETQGRKMAAGADGNASVWSLNMTNRFNWRSGRSEVVGDPAAPLHHVSSNRELTKEELLEQLKVRGLPTSLAKED